MSSDNQNLVISDVQPTVFLQSAGSGRLQQEATISLTAGNVCTGLTLHARAEGNEVTTRLEALPAGESQQTIHVPELNRDGTLELEIRWADNSVAHHALPWRKPKRWTVHVVQLSHHDAGYTDLKSSVLDLHDRYLGEVLELADATRDYPNEAQFRMTIEQTWSIDHFLHTAPPAQREKMIGLMQSGHVELTALFGNMVTNMCGHESLSRAMYHAFALKREHGIPILSAQHNDIPGFAWGLASALTEAGIKLFIPALPYFWSWTVNPYNSFWEQDLVFPIDAPGAFWWEAPSGKRVLLWCNLIGCNGDRHGSFKPLGERLQHWTDQGYAFDSVRWPVCGGFGDNSPYLGGFADGVKQWNTSYEYPRLISSTNTGFYNDFIKEDLSTLPVFRGELPEPDWPLGAMSTARATAASRFSHAALPSAERIATAAAHVTTYDYPAEKIAQAYEDSLWFDEHTWGHHLPCGPAVEAAKLEKAVHAHRAEALADEVANKAMSRIADGIEKSAEAIHLVVFNSLPFTRSSVISTPLRGLDNCGSDYNMLKDPESGDPLYFIVRLIDREHVVPSEDMKNGRFDLLDAETGASLPFQLETIGADDTVPFASERFGVGSGEKRTGGGEDCRPFGQNLSFIAEKVPACGYRTYRIEPNASPTVADNALQASDNVIENRFYRVELDPTTGAVASIRDKTSDRELVDGAARHGFGSFVVRNPQAETFDDLDDVRVTLEHQGAVSVSIVCRGHVHGHPAVTHSYTLYRDQKRIDYAIRILKDATPLLDAHAAFPFKLDKPKFRYEGVLSLLNPIDDYFQGAYSDNIPIQNWVKVSDDTFSILWSSLDSPSVSLGDLWPGYVSPAHRSVIGDALHNEPLKVEDLKNGWIYSNLFSNNFGTNFAVTQSGDFLFRFVLTTRDEDTRDAEAVAFGWDAVTPLQAMFTATAGSTLPLVNSFMEIENPAIVILAWKKSEDGLGWIVRLWNTNDQHESTRVRMPSLQLSGATCVNLVEENEAGVIEVDADGFGVEIDARSVRTIRYRRAV